jgi:hypothetical protein
MIHYDSEFSSISEACIRKNAPESLIAIVMESGGFIATKLSTVIRARDVPLPERNISKISRRGATG